MERLTERWGEGDVWVKDHDYVAAAHRLAAYEKTRVANRKRFYRKRKRMKLR